MKSPKPKLSQADIAAQAERDNRIASNQAAMDADRARRRRARGGVSSLLVGSQAGAKPTVLGVPG